MDARSILTRFAGLCVLVIAIASGSAASEEIPLTADHGTYTVPVRLNNAITLPFTVDTGAATVVIPADVASTLLRTGTLSQRDFIGKATAVIADGSTLPSLRVVLHEVRVGNQSVQNVVASVLPAKGDPLLGQSFLSKLPSWTLDYRRNALVVNGGPPLPQVAAIPPPAIPSPAVPAGSAFGGYGALAFDEVNGGYGLSSNQETQIRADYAAVNTCGSNNCKVVFRTAARQCAAIATSDTGKAWGAGKQLTLAAAELDAMNNCQKHTTGQCRLRSADCNR